MWANQMWVAQEMWQTSLGGRMFTSFCISSNKYWQYWAQDFNLVFFSSDWNIIIICFNSLLTEKQRLQPCHGSSWVSITSKKLLFDRNKATIPDKPTVMNALEGSVSGSIIFATLLIQTLQSSDWNGEKGDRNSTRIKHFLDWRLQYNTICPMCSLYNTSRLARLHLGFRKISLAEPCIIIFLKVCMHPEPVGIRYFSNGLYIV